MRRVAAALAGTVAGAALLIVAGSIGGLGVVHAAPPTVVPSPGYDARLRESRSVQAAPWLPQPRPRAEISHPRRAHHRFR